MPLHSFCFRYSKLKTYASLSFMVTVLKVTFTSGRIQRCDSRCHNAQGDKCSCCCNGTNHGVGLRQAVINSVESRDLDVKLPLNLVMLSEEDQLDLFPSLKPSILCEPKGD